MGPPSAASLTAWSRTASSISFPTPRRARTTSRSTSRRCGPSPPLHALGAAKARLPLLHERAAALGVVGAFRATRDGRAHALGVWRADRLHVFLDDGLRVGDQERRVF